MSANERLVFKGGKNQARHWMKLNVEKGKPGQAKAGYTAFAEEFHCKPEKEDVVRMIGIIYDENGNEAERMVRQIIANEAAIEKAKKSGNRKQRRALQKLSKLLNGSGTQQNNNGTQTLTETDSEKKEEEAQEKTSSEEPSFEEICKSEITAVLKEIECEKDSIINLSMELEALKVEAELKKERVEILQKELTEIAQSLSGIKQTAIEKAKAKEQSEWKLVELEKKLLELDKQMEEASALHRTLFEECVTENCELVDICKVDSQKMQATLMKIMFEPKSFSEEFAELQDIATVEEIKKVAQIMVLNESTEEKIYWHFNSKNKNVANLLEFVSGISVVIDEK